MSPLHLDLSLFSISLGWWTYPQIYFSLSDDKPNCRVSCRMELILKMRFPLNVKSVYAACSDLDFLIYNSHWINHKGLGFSVLHLECCSQIMGWGTCVGCSLPFLTSLCGFIPAVDGQMLRSSCLPKQLEAEWHFGGVKYQYGGNREGKLRQLASVRQWFGCQDKSQTLEIRFFLVSTLSVVTFFCKMSLKALGKWWGHLAL